MPGQRHEPDVNLETGDLSIGAVEIKDAATTSRASVEAANTARTTATKVLAVQHVDAAGSVLSSGNTAQTILFARIDDDTITGGTYSAAIVTATSAKKIYVVELFFMVDAQCELEWVEDPQGTPAILATAPPMFFAARGGAYLPRTTSGYHFATNTVNKALGLDEVANGTVGIRGYLWYYKDA